jgi:hypothetical protein
VACLPDNDPCPNGQYCEGTACTVGCTDDTDCDNGGGTPLSCDPQTNQCVGCVDDSTCAPGTICEGGACVAGCNDGHACQQGSECCTGQCVDTQTDALHCGGCDACPTPADAHANAVCNNGTCGFGPCDAGFDDCNGDPIDGCESDLQGQAGCACVPGAQVDCYTGPVGTKDNGPCVGGKKTCNPDGLGFGACEGEVTPQTETCDNAIDDDCNGVVNDGAADGGKDCVCAPNVVLPCYSGPAGTENVGTCKSGTKTCDALGTAWSACDNEVLPQAEDCATPGDENCDGQVNEATSGCSCAPGATQPCYGGPAGTENVGLCKGGVQTCDADGKGWGACEGQVVPAQETCFNDTDDDCNGQVNEGGAGCVCAPNSSESCYTGPAGTVGVGICKAGTKTCNALGTAYGACAGQVLPQPETCNTPEDDNCNGQVNEGGVGCVCAPNSSASCYTGPAGTLGVGICQAGTKTCNALGTAYGACAGQVLPQPETCNTPEDDNCNGQVNEGGAGCVCVPNSTKSCYTGPAGTVGVGTCKAGTQTCEMFGNAWGPCIGDVLPQPDLCNTAADEDCSGSAMTCAANQDCNAYSGVCEDPCSPALLGNSYVGCEYYPTVTLNSMLSNYTNFHFAVAIANVGAKASNYTITKGSQTIATGSVAANNVKTVTLPWVSELVSAGASIKSLASSNNGAYRVVVDRPVVVYQFNPLEYTNGGAFSFTNDASILLPVNAWTGNYRVVARNTFGGISGFYAVTASENGTSVTLSPSATGKTIKAGGGVAANGTGTIALNRGDVLQVLSGGTGAQVDPNDVTGTLVTATKPVQIIGGHNCIYVPANTGYCDHLEESVPPIEVLAKEYLVTSADIALNTPKARVVRIVATQPNTTLTYNPPQAGAPSTIAVAGDYVELAPTVNNFKITSNFKIVVAEYMTGQDYGGGAGDPAMTIAVATEQYRTDYLFHAPTSYASNFVNITAPTGTTVTLDGATVPAASFTAIGSSGYSVAKRQLANGGTGNHSVSSSSPFGITVYGYGQYTSYWYPGGMNLDTIIGQ